MQEEARRYRLWLSFVLGTAHARIQALLDAYEGDGKAVFREAALGCLPGAIQRELEGNALLHQKASEAYIDQCLGYMARHGIEAVLVEDENYPMLLRHIYRPPTALYVRGRLPKRIPLPLAMIGSRKCTDYGRQMALGLSKELAEQGVCVVSGLAYGIDCLCAQGALAAEENDFPTIAVLGGGVDVVYPAANQREYEQIVERGAVISEHLPGTKPMAAHFPQRNRIISGISRGVVVIEAAKQSGTSITVDCALEQGRDVFALPGRLTDITSEGANRMISEGTAKAVNGAKDILEEYGVEIKAKTPAKTVDESALSFEQTLILRLLQAGERSADDLAEMTGFSPSILNFALTDMEFSGIIKQSRGRLYSL